MDISEHIIIPAGTYVLAVSGGVDSVVLLDLLAIHSKTNLVIAHLDHGIRHNSSEDSEFVSELAKKYGVKFVTASAKLGKDASEETARNFRYDFLFKVAGDIKADGVITAHHQDDAIETCFINIIRGTGRHGLSSLKNRPGLYRPMLGIRKKEIINYAKNHNLSWREDQTNSDTKYLRNNLRLKVIPKMSEADRKKVITIIEKSNDNNEKIDYILNNLLRRGLHKDQPTLSRKWFSKLPTQISNEVIYTILKKYKIGEIDNKTVDRISVQVKTLQPGKKIQFTGGQVDLTKRSARFSC